MSFEFHSDKAKYFRWQYENCRDYVIPFIEEAMPLQKGMKVMEIGCGEGGVLKAFWERGCDCLGVELSPSRVENARKLMPEETASGTMDFLTSNIYDVKFEDYAGKWDLIVLKDAIEHIPDQEKIIGYLKKFLKPEGRIFFGFPPWRMPFGGHQQIAKSKLLSRWPWLHLHPRFMYKFILKIFGESQLRIDELMEIVDTKISINQFQKICKVVGFTFMHKQFYLVNPIYRFKFGIKPRKQLGVISAIPWFRDFYTTTVYYLVGN